MKFCKDCEFYRELDGCVKRPDLVTGGLRHEGGDILGSARIHRSQGWFWMLVLGVCGERGRWWKQKEVKP